MKKSLLIAVLIATAGCSTSIESASTVPSPNQVSTSHATTVVAPTVTTAASLTHALAFPDVPISVRSLSEDESSFGFRTRSEKVEDATIPEFVYGNDFTPSNMDLNPPRPVAFTNGFDTEIRIIFSAAEIPDLVLAGEETATVDFTALPEEIYRFHVLRGNAKVAGFVDMRPQGTSFVPEQDGTFVRQAPFSGRFSIEVPESSYWFFNPQHNAIVGLPYGDEWPQGDFQWSMASGAPLRSSGMRVQLFDAIDRQAVLTPTRIPRDCEPSGVDAVVRSGLAGEEATFECELARLSLGYLEVDQGVLVYVVSDSRADPADLLFEVLDTIEIHVDRDAAPVIKWSGPNSVLYSSRSSVPDVEALTELDGTYPVDIEGGDLGWVSGIFDVFSTTTFSFRNFDDVEYRLQVNGEDVAPLEPHTAVTVDLLGFGLERINVTIAAPPLVGFSMTIDTTEMVPGPPIEMWASTEPVALEEASTDIHFFLKSVGWTAALIDAPVGWTEVGEPVIGEYVYARQANQRDVAEIRFESIYPTDSQIRIEQISREARLLPSDAAPAIIDGRYWRIVQWFPEGNPAVTLAILEDEGEAVSTVELKSSSEDHQHLFDSVLVPMVESFELTRDG